MEGANSQEVWERCTKTLRDAGATVEFSNFFADILKTDYEMNGTLNRLHQALGPDTPTGKGQEPSKMLKVTQELVRNYNHWKKSVDGLQERGKEIPPLTLDPSKVKQSNALTSMQCKLKTKELNLQEGDQIWITDTSRQGRLKIRNNRGEEGYVPALACILPTPDKSAVTAIERLQIQLLASWVENVKKMRRMMMQCLLTTSKILTSEWRALTMDVTQSANKERITRRLRRLTDLITKTAPNWDLNKLHNALFSLEKELDSWQVNGTDMTLMVDTIANLDKSVLCYQMFTKQLYLFRKSLERVSRPIRIVESWDDLRAVQKGRFFRYIELKVTMESTETVEEIMEYIAGVTQYKEGSKNETVEADQITSASQEERKRFVITGVVHPRSGDVISLQEAVRTGIIDHSRGMYINPVTGQGISIPEAMNRAYIRVEQTTTTKSKEETKAIGVITIKTKIDNRSYAITGVVNSQTGKQLSLEEARTAGIIDENNSEYVNNSTGERLPLDSAIQSGWVLVEYEPEPEDTDYDVKTYAVNAVVDQKEKVRVPFMEAVKRGLIDRDTGSYINNVTGERVYVAEAIRRGFLKAKELEDKEAHGLDIDAENRVVIERMDKIRKNVLKSMGVISAFRNAAAAGAK